jgi:hypothetical protein
MSAAGMENFAYLVGAMSDPQKDAIEAQARQAAEYNKMMRDLFHESRGSTGHAFYSESLGGAEREFGNEAVAQAKALRDFYGTPQDVLNLGTGVAGRYKPLLEAGTKSIYGIYSGDEERKRLAAAEPTFAARRNLAETTRYGALKGISDRLNAIKSMNLAKGYIGAGSGSERLGFQAEMEGNQQAAGARGAAELANAADAQTIRNQILDQQLRGSELAGALAGTDLRFQTLPADVVAAISAAQLGPLAPFRLGPGGTPQQTMAPWAQPVLSPLGGILGGVGANAESLGRYFANRDLANRYGGAGARQPGGYAGPGYGYYDYSGAGGTTDYGGYSDFPAESAVNYDPNWDY